MRNCQRTQPQPGTRDAAPAQTAPRRSPAILAIGLALALLSGCGPDAYQRVPVSGTVTLDGQPLAGIAVTFQPMAAGSSLDAGPGSVGLTDQAGKFTLQTAIDKKPGAIVGKHRVKLVVAGPQRAPDDDTAAPPPADTLPQKYQDTELEFDVPAAGTDKADFALTSN